MSATLASIDPFRSLREALRREDPAADVRQGPSPDTVEIASNLPQQRVEAIMAAVLGMEGQGCCADGETGESCCGCCGE
ncbi:MAG: hypothetical protein JSS03_09810 [Proteobacteria bacterium]|nr:hypothetical protein [Pseudomonadota bacterium]